MPSINNRLHSSYVYSSPLAPRQGWYLSKILWFLFFLILVAAVLLLANRAYRPSTKLNLPPHKAAVLFPTVNTPMATGLNSNFARQVNECLIPAAAVYGFNLYIVSGFRSYADENALYAQGRTVDGAIISYAQGGQSFHNFGYAVDLADHADGENIDYGEIGSIAAWCGLEHGDRGYTDLPHFEYRGDLSLEEFQAGLRPLPLQLPCSLLDQRATAGQSLSLADLSQCGAPTFYATPGYVPGTPQGSGDSGQ